MYFQVVNFLMSASYSQAKQSFLESVDDNAQAPLNHDFSKERARLSRASVVPRKPPNRASSSNAFNQGNLGHSICHWTLQPS